MRTARAGYRVPDSAHAALSERLDAVLHVVYLVFNEGYLASHGETVTRAGLVQEAIRLGHQLVDLLPAGEARGLLALLLLHDSRREARMRDGEPVLLEDQDRGLGNRAQIDEGLALVRQCPRRPGGPPAAARSAHRSARGLPALPVTDLAGAGAPIPDPQDGGAGRTGGLLERQPLANVQASRGYVRWAFLLSAR